MPKIAFTCRFCSQEFTVFPAALRHADKRGSPIQFCSKKCVGMARTAGLIGAKFRRGKELVCEVCKNKFYRSQSHIKTGRSRFCSESCRLSAHENRLIDRTGPRPNRLLGKTIECMFCGKSTYRKKSMMARNIGKTCGQHACISAYGRHLWGLSPRSPEIVVLPRPKRKTRTTNFTPLQRKKLLAGECAYCGTNNNLTLDHIIPVCAGGMSEQNNAQTLCGPCNNWKAVNLDQPLARQQTRSGG